MAIIGNSTADNQQLIFDHLLHEIMISHISLICMRLLWEALL